MFSVKTLFVLLQLRALPSFLVRQFHVRHFQSTRFISYSQLITYYILLVQRLRIPSGRVIL